MRRLAQLALASLLAPAASFGQAFSSQALSVDGRPLPFSSIVVCSGWSNVLVQNPFQSCNSQVALTPPSAPVLAAVTGTNPPAGTYQVVITYVNGVGETIASAPTSITTSGGNLAIQITSPAAFSNATGWNAYFTVAGGSVFFKQNSSATAIGTNYTQSAAINTGGANPPTSTTATAAILPLATIYFDTGQTQLLPNPTRSDANGRYTFFAPTGQYTISVSLAGYLTYSYPSAPGSGTSGANPAAPAFAIQMANSGVNGFAASNIQQLGDGSAAINADLHTKGPNPWYDVTRYGARFFNVTTGPQSTTATCNSTTAVTLAAAIDFINGDGIVLHKCGPATPLTTPAAPSSVSPQGVLNGSTTRCYKIAAEDVSLGLTAASAATCTNTAASVFQSVAATITSVTASPSGQLTVTTSANHNFQTGWPVQLTSLAGTLAASLVDGVYFVQTAPTGTTFTVQGVGLTGPTGTPLGSLVATSGTATAAAHVFVYWASQATNVMRYAVYRQDGGAGNFNLVGIAQGIEPFFDDYNWQAPLTTPMPEIPSTAPASASNQALSTTIVSGAGTTSIVVFNSASSTISGVAALHDDSPGILSAVNTAIAAGSQGGSIYFPTGSDTNSSILINFPLSIPIHTSSGLTFLLSGSIYANQPILPNASENWFGINSSGGEGSFSTRGYATIHGGAYPLWLSFGRAQVDVEGISFSSNSPQQWDAINDQGGPSEPATITYRHDAMSGRVDQGGVGLTLRGNAFGINIDDLSINMFGLSIPFFAAPSIHVVSSAIGGAPFGWPGIATIKNSTLLSSGMQFDGNPTLNVGLTAAGSPWVFDNLFSENSCAPLIMFNNAVSGAWFGYSFENFSIADQSCGPAPAVDLCSPNVSKLVEANVGNGVTACMNNGTSSPSVVGINVRRNGVVSAPSAGYNFNNPGPTQAVINDSFGLLRTVPTAGSGGYYHATQPFGGILLDNPTLPTPTATLAAGGSIPIGTVFYVITVVDANGGESSPSQSSNQITTTTGNQSGNIAWTPVTYPIKGYNVYRSNGGGLAIVNSSGPCCLAGTFTDTTQFGASVTGNSGAFGLSSITPVGGVSSNLFTVFGGAFKSSISGAAFSANRTVSVPDVNGVSVVSGYQNSAYDNFNRANGAIGSNWTVAIGGYNVSSNTITSTSGSWNLAFWSGSAAFAPQQFSQVVLAGATVHPGPGVLLTTTNSGQGYSCDDTSTTLLIYRIVNNVNTTLNSAAHTQAIGDVIRLEVATGGVLTCYVNGVALVSATDTQITSGSPGLAVFGTGTLDNWSGGNLHPIAQLDAEEDWTQPQHFLSGITLGSSNGNGAGGSELNLISTQGSDSKVMTAGTVTGTSAPLCTDTNGGATTSTCPGYLTVQQGGTSETQRPTLNFINGTNMTVSCVDNAGSTRTDCTFTSSATAATAWSAITAATNSNTGTFAASGNTWDWTATTIFKLRTGAGLTSSANGDIGFDTTNTNWHAWNGADRLVGLVNGSPANNDCAKFVLTGNKLELTTQGAACATFYQTVESNATAVTQRATLNLASGTGVTVSCSDNSGQARTDCTFSGTSAASVQVFSSTNVSATQISNTSTTLATRSVTMPSSGCPCRAHISYSLHANYAGITNSNYTNTWVSDGTNTMAGVETAQSNGSSGARTSLTYGGFSTVTYSNSANITFTLIGIYSASPGPTLGGNPDQGSGPSDNFQIAIFTSN